MARVTAKTMTPLRALLGRCDEVLESTGGETLVEAMWCKHQIMLWCLVSTPSGAALLQHGFGLTMSRGGICRAMQRVARKAEATWHALRDAASLERETGSNPVGFVSGCVSSLQVVSFEHRLWAVLQLVAACFGRMLSGCYHGALANSPKQTLGWREVADGRATEGD
jgi:hypothetical protein